MLPINPSMLRPIAPDMRSSTSAAVSMSDPAGFASLLKQSNVAPAASRAPAPPPAPAPMARAPIPQPQTRSHAPAASNDPPPRTASKAPDEASNDPSVADAKASDARADAVDARGDEALVDAKRARGAAAKSGRARAGSTDAQSDATSDAKSATVSDPAKAPAERPIDPNTLHWMLGQAPRPSVADASSGRGDAPTESGDDGIDKAPRDAASTRTPIDLEAEADGVDRQAANAAAGADGVAEATRSADLMAEVVADSTNARRGVDMEQQSRAGAKTIDVGASAHASFAATLGAARESAAAPLAVALPTPVDAPEFAQHLGLQLSVLARDGVQHAELHLNPADMGPVSVQIVMDGTQARVDFGADVAATRQAIEAGLPQLASALSDAGFTLAGGGVSQHAGSRNDAQGHAGSGQGATDATRRDRAVDDEPADRLNAVARRRVAMGGVDLFA